MKSWLGISNHKVTSRKGFTGKEKHNLRQAEVPNADPSKSYLNEELISLNGKSMYQAFRDVINKSDYYKDHDIAKNAVWGFELTLGVGSEFDKDGNLAYPEKFDEERWKERCVEWLKDKYGPENVISAVLHKDETLPHIHAVVVPLMTEKQREQAIDRWEANHEKGKDGLYRDNKGKEISPPEFKIGRLNCAAILGYKKEYSELAREYNDFMHKEFGFEKTQGKSYDRGGYERIQEFYKAITEATIYKLPEPKHNELAMDYLDRAQRTFDERNLQNLEEVNRLKKDIKELEHTIDEQNIEQSQLMNELNEAKRLIGDSYRENKKKLDAIDLLKEGLKSFPDKVYAETIKEGIDNIYEHAVEHSGRYDMTDRLSEMLDK